MASNIVYSVITERWHCSAHPDAGAVGVYLGNDTVGRLLGASWQCGFCYRLCDVLTANKDGVETVTRFLPGYPYFENLKDPGTFMVHDDTVRWDAGEMTFHG